MNLRETVTLDILESKKAEPVKAERYGSQAYKDFLRDLEYGYKGTFADYKKMRSKKK